MEESVRKNGGQRKWYDKYLPFVARSPEMQIEWLTKQLSKLNNREQHGKGLTKEEISPYIKLFLEGNCSPSGDRSMNGCDDEPVLEMFKKIPDTLLPLLMECTDIYDVPKLFRLISRPGTPLAIAALKKVPPPYEKNPLLIIDRVFHAIKEVSGKLLESAAESLLAADDKPVRFSENYERFKEIMMDEHILSLLYPKAR